MWFSDMDLTRASEYTSMPSPIRRSCPAWNAFSMTMPMPATSMPAYFARRSMPNAASPLARKSSMNSTFSPGTRNSRLIVSS